MENIVRLRTDETDDTTTAREWRGPAASISRGGMVGEARLLRAANHPLTSTNPSALCATRSSTTGSVRHPDQNTIVLHGGTGFS